MQPRRARALRVAIEGLQRLSDGFEQRREQLAREVGLSVPQWRVLEEVASEDFMPSLFARRRDCSPAAVSKTLRPLVAGGLIRASISREDARRRSYDLTARGRRALERLRSSRQRAIESIWSDLSLAELEGFARFSERLAERLEDYVERELERGNTATVSKTS